MLQRDQDLAFASGAGGEDVFTRPDGERTGAGDAGKNRDVEDADRNDGIDRAGTEDRGDHDGGQQRREGKDEIVQPHQGFVDEPSARRGPAAQRYAETQTDADGNQGNGNGVARTDHDHRQDVTAEMVGAEPV